MNLTNVIVGAFVFVCIGSGAGVMAYASVNPAARVAIADSAPPPLTAKTAPRTSQDVGTIGTFGSRTLVWVDDLGLSAWNRAFANRDDKGMETTMRIFDSFDIPVNAQIKITQRSGTTMQVEVLDGPMTGRRGWLDATERVVR